jgi:polyisoprenoid-binding protein YceI
MSTTASPTFVPTGTWTVDPPRSKIGFAVMHSGVATVRGEFRDFEGVLENDDRFSTAKVRGTVKLASVNTGEPRRDDHLRSRDFFDAERYPDLTFEASRLEAGDGRSFRIIGNLTVHGVTKEIVLRGQRRGIADVREHNRLGLEVTGTLSRRDYGLKFKRALRSGNAFVADKVDLVLCVSLKTQPVSG